ncbi:MAG: hypothetical protein J2P25_09800 [Nocardiopsaceae bacterium]|nr:hypothetical protein [Nocardiopsaceae bacterium]
MFTWWDVVPDGERQQWTLDPFTSVGPLDFDMSPHAVSKALSNFTGEPQRHQFLQRQGETRSIVTEGSYRKFGLYLYYRDERLAGIVVNALHGPQVLVEGVKLVGQVPSILEQWMVGRAENRPDTELIWMAAGMPASESLGLIIGVQRAGDHLITKPIFMPEEALVDGYSEWLPNKAWTRYW